MNENDMTLDDIENELSDLEIERERLAAELGADMLKIANLEQRKRNTMAAMQVADAFIHAWSVRREKKLKGEI